MPTWTTPNCFPPLPRPRPRKASVARPLHGSGTSPSTASTWPFVGQSGADRWQTGPGTSGFCEVNTPDAFSLTHGERRYQYMAPCRIESVSPDGLTIIALVEYDRPCSCADLYNGERLRLDLTEVWPPVWLLSAQRHEQQTNAAIAAAAHQPLGAAPWAVHPWDTGGRGPIGSPKAGKAVLRCPHCQVTFYERPTCPSCAAKLPAL